MKKILLLTIGLSCLAAAVSAQETEEDTKTRINRIKRDTSYLYGEATMPEKQEAMTLAKDFLCSYIEQWIAETRDTQKIRSVVAKDLIADCEELSLMRGNMFRAFAYVRKSDLYAVDTDAFAIPISGPTAAQTEPVASDAETAGEPAANAVSAAGTAVQAAAGTAVEPMAGTVEESVTTQAAPVSDGSGDPAAEAAPQADSVSSADALLAQLIRDLCAMQTRSEVERLLQGEPYAAAYNFGDVGYATRPQDIEKGILVIYKPGTDAISALLGLKSPKRTNLKTGKEDSTVNYPGCRAMWICSK